jgi:V/A-type H+-transporting ATPase subunit F
MTDLVRVVCRPVTAPGFALAGLPVDAVAEGSDAAAVLAPLLVRPEVGAVLLEESIYESLPPDLKRRVDRSPRPVVVPFPGPAWRGAGSAEARVVELLRRAIGYRVRLQ